MFLVMIALINIGVFAKLIYEAVFDLLDCWKFWTLRTGDTIIEDLFAGLWAIINIFISVQYILFFIFLA